MTANHTPEKRRAFYIGTMPADDGTGRRWNVTLEVAWRPDKRSASFVVVVTDPRLRRDDGFVISAPGTGAAEILRQTTGGERGLPGPVIDELARMADAYHLNDMNAGTAWHDAWIAGNPPPDDIEQRYGQPDVMGWRLRNVPADPDGNRYGHAWYRRDIPDRDADRIARMAGGESPAAALAAGAQR